MRSIEFDFILYIPHRHFDTSSWCNPTYKGPSSSFFSIIWSNASNHLLKPSGWICQNWQWIKRKKTYFLKWPTTASICIYLYDFGILQECLYFSASSAYSASMIPVDTGQFQENLPVMEQDLEAKKPKCRHHFGQSCSLPIKGVAIGSLHLQSLKLTFSPLNIGRNPKGKEASNHQFSGPMLVSGGFISQFSLVWQKWFDQYFSSLSLAAQRLWKFGVKDDASFPKLGSFEYLVIGCDHFKPYPK